MEKIEYPIRINRYLYLKNICSRREADRLIEKKMVLINKKPAKLGQKVEKNDKVEIKNKAKKNLSQKKIIIFNKPVGVVSHNPQFNEKEPNNFFDFSEKLSPVGRLDKNSHGLLLMSNDGRIVNKLLNPKFNHEKEYILKVDKKITPQFLKKMSEGVDIEGYITKPAKLTKLGNREFSIILTEGKKHQIRRMCAALGYKVEDLKRIRFMHILIGDLKEGQWRKLSNKEHNILMKKIS